MKELHKTVDPQTLATATEILAERARRDSKTGLLNKEAMDRHIEGLLLKGDPFLVVDIDIDDFKRVNDENGHEEGDALILMLSGLLGKLLDKSFRREGDRVEYDEKNETPPGAKARMGGDEFRVVIRLDELETGDRARTIPEAIQHLKEYFDSLNKKFIEQVSEEKPHIRRNRLGLSVGIVAFDPHESNRPWSLEELSKRADDAMYEDKRRRKRGGPLARRALARVITVAQNLERKL